MTPFAATPTMNIEVEVEQTKTLFSVSYMVYNVEQARWILDAVLIVADSADEAESRVMRWAHSKYSECTGHFKHKVKATEVSLHRLATDSFLVK